MRYLAILSITLLVSCGTVYRDTQAPISAQADFDPDRYLGTWFEIARYPVPFQRGCTATQATYAKIDADTVTVENTCRDETPEGPIKRIVGTADVVGPGRLKVQFASVPFVRSDYWVLWVDQDYQTAVVGVPNGRAGWILARQPMVSAPDRARAEDALRQNGYDPSALIEVAHTVE